VNNNIVPVVEEEGLSSGKSTIVNVRRRIVEELLDGLLTPRVPNYMIGRDRGKE
jgi:hypothetical protein